MALHYGTSLNLETSQYDILTKASVDRGKQILKRSVYQL